MYPNSLCTKGKCTIKSTPTLTNIEFGRLLWHATRSATRVYRLRLAELELTNRQAAAILALVEAPGITLRELSETLGADRATASALIDRLLAADLVRRETNPDDRRRVMLYPTLKSLELAETLAAAGHASEERIKAVLGERDSAKLAALLDRLIDGLKQPKPVASPVEVKA